MSPQHWVYTLRLRLRSLFWRDRMEKELAEEMQFHLEEKKREYEARGMSAEEARRAAMRDMDGMELRKEECRDARRVSWVEDLGRDLRYAVRMLLKSPGFTVVVVLTLALGIGANTAIFSVVDAVLLRQLPYPQAERLLAVVGNQSLPDLEDMQRQAKAFAAMGGITQQALDYTGENEPLQVYAGLCNAELFAALRKNAGIGRVFSGEESHYGGARVVVLTHGFWERHFGADKNVVGRSIPLSGDAYTIIGVMPADFWMPGRPVDLLAPLRVANANAAKFRGVHFLRTYFRLKDGVTMAAAQGEIDGLSKWLEKAYPDENTGRTRRLVPLREYVVGDVKVELEVLFSAVGFVLLIACANFANLLLARAGTRQREMTIRGALGAGPGRLVRQMLTESVLLSLCGGAAGLAVVKWGVPVLLAMKPDNLPRVTKIDVDARVLLFTLGISVLTGLVFGMLPAMSALRLKLSEGLKETALSMAAGAAGARLRKALVASEIALALVLLTGAGLLIRSFTLLHGVDPGFRADSVLTMRVELPAARYEGFDAQRQFRKALLDSLNGLSGVQAAMISELPMSGDSLTHNFVIEGRPAVTPGEEPELQTRTVQGDYFGLMGIPLLQGRGFSEDDGAGTQHVVVVNQAFVKQYMPKKNPIGERIAWARGTPRDWMVIVGVAGDVKQFGPNLAEEPAAYDLYSQTKQPWKRWMYLTVKSDRPTETILGQVKESLWVIDKQIPLTHVSSMSEVEGAAMDSPRFNLTLLGIFAAVALLLATIGIYGVMSYSMTQRTQEIGVRMALGAQRRDILWLAMREGGKVAATGVVAGVLASLVLTRYMESLLFGVSARDPQTFTLVVVLLATVAMLACYVPTRRAARMDAMDALRYE